MGVCYRDEVLRWISHELRFKKGEFLAVLGSEMDYRLFGILMKSLINRLLVMIT